MTWAILPLAPRDWGVGADLEQAQKGLCRAFLTSFNGKWIAFFKALLPTGIQRAGPPRAEP